MKIFAVSGIKNSGKTTLLARLLPVFREKGIKVAVIKHDGHEFEADVPGTDSYRHFQAGAYGTAVYSATKLLLVKQQGQLDASQLLGAFPEADLILLEGFKHSEYPKLEIIRRENSMESVCLGYNLRMIVSDAEIKEIAVPVYPFDALEEIAEQILEHAMPLYTRPDREEALWCKTKLVLSREKDFFGPGICRLLQHIDALGSIQAAASEMELSYTKAWKMVNKAEKETGIIFLTRSNGGKKGGSSRLTEEGRRFLQRYEAMSGELKLIGFSLFQKYFGDEKLS